MIPNDFFRPLQLQGEQDYLQKCLHTIDSWLINPYKDPWVIQKEAYTYRKIAQIPAYSPLFKTALRIAVLAIALLALPKTALIALSACFLGKVYLRKEMGSIDQSVRLQSEVILCWVQKYLCSHYATLFCCGLTENLPLKEEEQNQPVTVKLGQEQETFSRSFLEKIPFFKGFLLFTQKNSLVLDGLSPFNLEDLRKIHKFEQGRVIESLDTLDSGALNFLGYELASRVTKQFANLLQFQEWIEAKNTRLGDLDLTLFTEKPQVKVPSFQQNFKYWNVPELKPVQEFIQRLDPQNPSEIDAFLTQYMANTPTEYYRYLAVNAVIDAWITELHHVGNPDLFLRTLDSPSPWHAYLTVLSLSEPAYDHRQLSKITLKCPNLLWLSFNFFPKGPDSILDWIHSFNAHCQKLRVLSISGTDVSGSAITKTVLDEMKNLDIFELA